jgi:hypothetical protein
MPLLAPLLEIEKSIHGLLGKFTGIEVEVEVNHRDRGIEVGLQFLDKGFVCLRIIEGHSFFVQ